MTIRLPEDLEAFVHEAVRLGLYPREDDVILDALSRLKEGLDEGLGASGPAGELIGEDPERRPMTEEESKCKLIDLGLMSDLPRPGRPASAREFRPIHFEGEPLSEAIIRERR